MYLWRFVDGRPIVNARRAQAEVPATSAESDALSKDLKRRGFKFVGSTVIYAHMQATGLVNDHLVGCFRYEPCRRAVGNTGRGAASRPGLARSGAACSSPRSNLKAT